MHVNLIDLIDSRRTRRHGHPGQTITVFGSKQILKQYTLETGKFFPLGDAKKDSLKKVLLRHIR